jgi:hypothetical protein
MGRKLFIDASGAARVDRRKHRALPTEPLARVHQTWRYIQDSVRSTTDSDDVIVARAKAVLRGTVLH